MLVRGLLKVARALLRLRQSSWLILRFAQTPRGIRMMLWLLARLPDVLRPLCIKAAQRVRLDEDRWGDIIRTAAENWQKHRSVPHLETLALSLIGAQKFPEALALFEDAGPQVVASSVTLRNALTICQLEVGNLPAAMAAAKQSFEKNPRAAKSGSDCLYGAFAAGHLRDLAGATELFAAHFDLIDPAFAPYSEARLDAMRRAIARKVVDGIPEKTRAAMTGRRTGVFFLSATQALGHAILDPYHFLALTRGTYDQVLFIGPPRDLYNEAPAVCIDIIEQYGEYIETTDDLLINLSWMSLGRFSVENVEFFVSNYWSLLREVTLRSGVPNDDFKHNAWHMSLPAGMQADGEAFCAKAGIDTASPLIVLHARDMGYHRIVKQSYRDVDVSAYGLAIQGLLDRGYQVVRIGDTSMKPLRFDSDRYFELPFMDGYRPTIDPYLIWRCQFMIGCQSGPCAYARAFGKPLLSINAVYHYTLLPTPREQAAFKHYLLHETDGTLRELSIAEALNRNVFWLENSHQFEDARIEVRPLAPEEIDDAVRGMIAWVMQDSPESDGQRMFSRLTKEAAARIHDAPKVPVADFLGFALPGYRLTPQQAAQLLEDGDNPALRA